MHSFKKIWLYFLPGLLPSVFLIIFHSFFGEKLPSIHILIFLDLTLTIPLMLFLIARDGSVPFGLAAIKNIFQSQVKLRPLALIGLIALALVWALGSFALLGPVNAFLQQKVFAWLPAWWTPGLYPDLEPCMLKWAWMLMIPFSILMPLTEEIYFRGFLLPKEKPNNWRAPLINTILFCAYHLWSPQFLVTRIIATYPMTYLVWRYKNIYLSIIPHVLLNLIGDVILTHPMAFG